MKKALLCLFGAAVACTALLTPATALAATPFSVTYNFDDDADFPGGVQNLPGWKSNGTKPLMRYRYDEVNVAVPCSGDYVLSSMLGKVDPKTDIVTPAFNVVAGEPVTIDFKYYAYSTNHMAGFGFKVFVADSQDATTDKRTLIGTVEESTEYGQVWHDASFTYTPEADGDIYFSIYVYNSFGQSLGGYVALDDITVSGMTADAETPALSGPFTVEEDFDALAAGSTSIEGWNLWGANIQVNTGTYFGTGAKSGDNVLGVANPTADHGIFTPAITCEAGKPYTMEFYYRSSGVYPRVCGVEVYACDANLNFLTDVIASDAASNMTDWKKITAKFTPEADGEYCFAIGFNALAASMYGGTVVFDSFVFEGTAPAAEEPEPEPAGGPFTVDQDFDALAAGSTSIEGWNLWGANIQVNTGTYFGTGAKSGDNVLGVANPTADHGIFTPAMTCEAGKPYTMEFYYRSSGVYPRVCGVEVYACDAELNFLTDVIASDAASNMTDWKKITATFTPEADGEYCFAIGFNALAASMYGGTVVFDSFVFEGTAPGQGGDDPEPAGPVAFENEFNFDADATGTQPEGWVIEGANVQVNMGSYFGTTAQSGDNVLGCTNPTSAHGIFTPLQQCVGGKPYTIEFYYLNSGSYPRVCGIEVYGCDAQNSADGIITDILTKVDASVMTGWQKVTASFTPEVDGEYCFAIGFNAMTPSMFGGSAFFDSFIISGMAPGQGGDNPEPDFEFEPNEDNLAYCEELPYFEAFDGKHYDGTSYLPDGWHTTGTVTWITASLRALPAAAGDYYAITYHNTEGERDDNMYTCFFNLEAGSEYTISYKLFMQGNDYNENYILSLPSLDFTVGTEQEREFHYVLGTFSEKCEGWVDQQFKFTPKVSGPYCFAWMLTGPTNSGVVAIDDLKINADGLVARVEPSFHVKGIYDLADYTKTVSFPGHALQMVNTTEYADSYAWSVEGAEPSTSTEANPAFVFPENGTYTIKLEATNARGTRSAQRTVNIALLDEEMKNQIALHLQGPSDQIISSYIPAFDTHEQDYVSGFNHYYKKFAQRYDFAKTMPMYIDQLSFYTLNCKMVSYPSDQGALPMHFVLYGSDEDGNLDPECVLYDYETTVANGVGVSDNSGLGGFYARNVVFPEAVKVDGTFYLAMEFDNRMLVDAQDVNAGRSYLSTAMIKHGHGQTTLYACPFNKPANSDVELNKWCKVSDLDNKMKGLGAYWMLWAHTYDVNKSGITAIGADGTEVAAATFFGDQLVVTSTKAGDTVRVFNLGGAQVASAAAAEGTTTIELPSLPAGIYVVATSEASFKVCK